MIGRALNGRYELVGTLGVGGMATVWHGVDRVLGRQVAVKVLNGGLAEDPRFAERFGREAQHAAMLVHPRIAMVFDSGMDEGSAYIVMELIRGRSLGSVLAEGGPLPIERAVGIAAAVCEALEVAHAAGLVHRDIKPGNVMITDDGGVKVVDFGIARASASGQQLTQTASVLGTAAYLSPEQATAAEVDGRADLYALGCVLTEMLTGEPPFTADTPVGIAFKQVSEEALPVSLRRPEVPRALDQVVARLLAKRPADRPASAAAARAELLAAVPVAGSVDRTSELLATPLSGPDGDRTTMLPPIVGAHQQPHQHQPHQHQPHQQPPYRTGAGAAPTSVMAPVPAPGEDGGYGEYREQGGYGEQGGYNEHGGFSEHGGYGEYAQPPGHADGYPEPTTPARRSRRTLALVLGAVGLAGIGLVGALVFANSGNSANSSASGSSGSSAAKSGQQPTAPAGAAPAPSSAPVTAATPAPGALPPTTAPVPSAPPSKPGGGTPAAQIGALRGEVSGAPIPKDRQAGLVHTLDAATAALGAGQPQDAVQALKAAQRQVRDLSKKHAVDGPTAASWQHQLGVTINALTTQANQQDNADNADNTDGGNN
ncbi:protein kinase domain-containing protein [Kitasatospora kifunensis]|uniref:non-specific serine/threonine protein kinase n=1 Tax=Kitasatospora kifunensis TaxID=58351 RepID=A0A7W7R3T9_KITKI|nr:protein kinase [Kitasatospora kifunensis]MBB4924952.1 serine/threonine-protein kinase [Kitasatospora kifunensis]